MGAEGMSEDDAMEWPGLPRRRLVAAGATLGLATLLAPAAFAADATATEVVDLAVPGRTGRMSVWRPATIRGVVLFSTGFGSWPERYARLTALLTAQGFVILAPLHVDSTHNPDRANSTSARYSSSASPICGLHRPMAPIFRGSRSWPPDTASAR